MLEVKQLSKSFEGNYVLKNVSLSIEAGEIYGLIGANGSGKSTLMNVLIGLYQPTEGKIFLNGKEVRIDSPAQAVKLGIGMVHQEFMLIPGFTVTENIKVGREISTPNLASRLFGKSMETLDTKAMRKDAKKALKTIGLQIEDYVKVAGLPVGYAVY